MATSTQLLPGNQGQAFVPFGGGTNGGSTSLDTLNLANGMTAGWGVGDGNTQNPPLIGSWGGPLSPYGGYGSQIWPISRVGMLRTVPGQEIQGQAYTLFFLYNPNQINVSFTMDPSLYPPNYVLGAYNPFPAASTPATTQSQSVSWSLLFDRTYDMLYSPNPNGNRGVLKDIGALYLLMGTFVGGANSAAVPTSTLVEAIFGQTDDGDIWGFTGFISSVSITYGIFRHNMIPSRAEVDLTMTTTYVAPSVPSTGGNAGTDPSGGSVGGTSTSIPGEAQIPSPPIPPQG